MTTMQLHDTHPGRTAVLPRSMRHGPSRVLQWTFATLREWRRRTRERAQLATLNDRMLQDIGLTRGDAEFLSNKPFWRE